ncbi:hypothetical protein [Rhodanobacter lindaniclasticus]
MARTPWTVPWAWRAARSTRSAFSLAATLGFIQDDYGNLELTGKARFDTTRVSNDRYGGYARLMLIDAE